MVRSELLVKRLSCFALVMVVCTAGVRAEDAPLVRLTFQDELPNGRPGEVRTVEGKIAAERGGVFALVDRGGRMWIVTPNRLRSREDTGERFRPFTMKEAADAMQEELGAGFQVTTTRHYVLCSETNREFTRWTGLLFERLMAAFRTHWNRRPLVLAEPEFPLVAIILKDQSRFQQYGLEDAGPEVMGALGYYSTLTNRMVMYDLTAGQQPRNLAELNTRLAGQISNVSTIVHEATHQIAFNSGVHTRLADNPFWFVEGLAMYFETPDLKNASGWKTVGQLNTMRLRNYQDYVQRRRAPGSLQTMLSADARFHAADTALDAYAEAWALTHYLIQRRRADYVRYIQQISAKQPLERDAPEDRLAEFEATFGKVEDVEREMTQFLSRQQPR